MYAHIRTDVCVYTCEYTFTHIYSKCVLKKKLNGSLIKNMHTYVYVYIRMYTYVCIHTYILSLKKKNVSIHTYVNTRSLNKKSTYEYMRAIYSIYKRQVIA
jgi:hypothetical protein